MFCTSKEWDTCEVEKRGCEGCFYNMSEKETLERVNEVIKFMIEDNYNVKRFVRPIQNLMNLYVEAVKTSHYIQYQLDKANADLLQKKEKNKKLEKDNYELARRLYELEE